ncbi:MAG: EBSC protein [Firmicutes bacterium HGW-Firmicutes-4]|jgi:prolyl-tRNA editing enzyme YbaK/EbsC (Cys-tRNA(Pro) deacylase)|nr:MAG: EBSC protein [Firmicutes bacterium HGW-Firmicutes-4]
MAIEKVRDYFKQWNIETRILEFETSSATVELAAQAVGCAPERIAKTLSFKLAEKCVLVVVAGDARIDNSKFKAHFNTKAKMIPPEEVEHLVGHGIGGVCPFAVNSNVDIYLDDSLKRFDTVYPACGSSNSAIELTIAELEKYSNSAGWFDLCKDWQPVS